MPTVIEAAADDYVVSIEYDPTGLAWAHLWDNKVLSWIIDETGAAEPVPVIVRQDATRAGRHDADPIAGLALDATEHQRGHRPRCLARQDRGPVRLAGDEQRRSPQARRRSVAADLEQPVGCLEAA